MMALISNNAYDGVVFVDERNYQFINLDKEVLNDFFTSLGDFSDWNGEDVPGYEIDDVIAEWETKPGRGGTPHQMLYIKDSERFVTLLDNYYKGE